MIRVRLAFDVTEPDGDELWPVYDAVFGDQPDSTTWHASSWDRHVRRDGFRLARAYEGTDLVGFAYGYTGEHGQWWTDQAARVLDPVVAACWLGGHFELVSIGVVEVARCSGAGTALMRGLTDGLPHQRWLLMTTSDADDAARRLYAREGWEVVGPGLRDDQVIMGRARG